MTLRDAIMWLGTHPQWGYIYFAGLPLLCLFLFIIPTEKRPLSPNKYIYSVLTYLATLPGMFALVLIIYSLFFVNENLLDVNMSIYFLPVFCMFVSLVLIGKQVRFQYLPGFDRLAGLMVLTGLSCFLALILRRLFVGIFFGGGFMSLLVIIAVIFVIFKWALYSMTRSKSQPKRKIESFIDLI